MIELSKAPCNSLLEIKSLRGAHGWQNRLESVGIVKGRKVRKIVCQPFGGPVVIDIDGSRISLGRGIAANIDVEVVQTSAKS
ncbi:MAG: ferrous iron transport protein A [Methanosarcinales archaeon]|nr:ferrous iron transport protein A [Methanosarcinales archaeon]